MKFKEWLFNEMPLQHYGYEFHSSNPPQEGFRKDKTQIIKAGPDEPDFLAKDIDKNFSRRDKILISHPKTFKVLEDKLRNSQYNWIILLIEGWGRIRPDDPGYAQQIQEYLFKNKLDVTNSIVFAKNSTSGHLLTPWMILHTIGHAVSETKHVPKPLYQDLTRETGETISRAPISIFAFKSARTGNVLNSSELRHELIAEFLYNGRIRINEIEAQKLSDSSVEYVKLKIKRLEDLIKQCLDHCVGKIIYDYGF